MVLFVRRDEVHNPDSSNKGVAEIIIGKQRNGPIGTVASLPGWSFAASRTWPRTTARQRARANRPAR